MYREFSENYKKELLRLVSAVENSETSDFTDWSVDRWSNFEYWISYLNIRSYISNVNSYHRKVFDKNNATKDSIVKIFNDVTYLDMKYAGDLSEVKIALQKWQNYIDQLRIIVEPSNGKFNIPYINNTMKGSLTDIKSIKVSQKNAKTNNDLIIAVLKASGSGAKKISEYMDKKKKSGANNMGLTSTAISYLGSLYTFLTDDYEDAGAICTGGLNFTKASTSAFSGFYNFLEKTLNSKSAIQASRFGKKYQTKVGVISAIGSFLGFTGDSIKTYKTLTNKDAEAPAKVSQVFQNVGSGADFVNSIFRVKYGKKVLTRNVHAKYEWGVAAKNVTKLDKANTIVSVIGVAADTISGASDRYGKVTSDGHFDMRDIGEVGVAGSVRGLTSTLDKWTLGFTDAIGLSEKANDITDGLIDFTDNTLSDYAYSHKLTQDYVKATQGLKDYADNEENNIVGRVAVSALAGTGMVATVAIDGISDGVSWVGNKISSGWKAVKNWF